MRVIRNLTWGLLSAIFVFGTTGVVVLGIYVLSGEERTAVDELGGPLFLFVGYVAAAVTGGITLGLLRPFARSTIGRSFVGGVVASFAFSAAFLVWMGHEFWAMAPYLMSAMFVPGALTAPFWYHTRHLLPDFDARLRNLVHSTSLKSGDDAT